MPSLLEKGAVIQLQHYDCKNCVCEISYHINRDDVVDNYCCCTLCVQEIFPFNHLDNDDDFNATVMEGGEECPYRLHEIGNIVFLLFEISDWERLNVMRLDGMISRQLLSNRSKRS